MKYMQKITRTKRHQSKVRATVTSLTFLPVALVVVFCFGFELMSLHKTAEAPSVAASHKQQEPRTTTTTTLPQVEVAPQSTLSTIEVPVITPDITEASAPTANGTATLQPSASASTTGTNPTGTKPSVATPVSQPKASTTKLPTVQQLLTQKLTVTNHKK